MHLSDNEFESIVEQALAELPENFSLLLQNIAVIVEDEPAEDDLEVLDDRHDELLGIYRGVPRINRTYDMLLLPDQVAIFRGPILRVSRNRADAIRQIRETVLHELGHYFGLRDGEMVF